MKKRRRSRLMITLSAGLLAVLLSCLSFGAFFVSAHEEADMGQFKYYKSIQIQPGDTLWEIAEDTMTSEYDSVAEYVDVLKDMNSLSSDNIEAGQYLMIAYNDTEFKE